MSRPPNIVVILADRLRRDALNCMGDANLHTPNIDALARQGVTCTAACSTSPNSVPFRFSLMTGEYAHSRSVPALGYRLSPAERTLGEAIAEQGYATAFIGKWHLYGHFGVVGTQTRRQAGRTPVPAHFRRGFDYWRGFDVGSTVHGTHYFADDDPVPRQLPGAQTSGLFDLAATYIGTDRPADRPFFLILSLEAPDPLAAVATETTIPRGPLQLRANVDLTDLSCLPTAWRAPQDRLLEKPQADPQVMAEAYATSLRAYYDAIESVDAGVGRLRDRLAAAGLDRSTVIVFAADHGDMAGSHGLFAAGEPFEESIGIPLIFHSADPALLKGDRQSALPICTEDIFPTLVGLAGAVPPARPGRLDLSPFLRGTAAEPSRPAVLLEFVAEVRPTHRYFHRTWRGIRTRSHKYTVLGGGSGGTPWQLFDVEADPFEQNNLIVDPACAGLGEALHEDLRRLLRQTADDYLLAPFADDTCAGVQG